MTAHEAPVVISGWVGAGVVAIDQHSGAGAYLIEGGRNGGETPTETTDRVLAVLAIAPVSVLASAGNAAGQALNLMTFAATWVEGFISCYAAEIVTFLAIIIIAVFVAGVIMGTLGAGSPVLPGAAALLLGMLGANASAASKDQSCGIQCSKASNFQLTAAEIFDEHSFKMEWTYPPPSIWDICACKNGEIVIFRVGACGRIDGSPILTDRRWK